MFKRKLKFKLPKTVDEAAEFLISQIRTKEMDTMTKLTEEEFMELYKKTKPYIETDFKIYTGNDKLLRSCMSIDHTSNPAMVILRTIKEKLQKIHYPNIIIII